MDAAEKIFKDKNDFIEQYRKMFITEYGREFEDSYDYDRYYALATLIMNHIKEAANNTRTMAVFGGKKVFYFSMEFLIGKLLKNYLIYFGVEDIVSEGLADLGESLEHLVEVENDPGLGNGGLGRLAACYLDSMASLGIYGFGNGIRYKYGLFKQVIEDGKQVEYADNWIERGYPWEIKKTKNAIVVRFGGRVERSFENGKLANKLVDTDDILAVPYDVPILGYGGETVNVLRLWQATPLEEKFDMDAFNRGDYPAAMKHRADIEAISTLLYPDDSKGVGKLLRLKQEYMFVSAGLATIVRDYKKEHPGEWEKFPERIVIHTNDTHPAMCAPELLRILIDEEGLEWDDAWKIVTNTISYTNHTILPEALETWPIDMFQSLLPRVYDFVEEIDRRYKEKFPRDIDNWQTVLKNTAILWDGKVKMANLSVIAGHSVNGVAKLHTDILKERVLKDFYLISPEKFNNKTNGISHRRFLGEANPEYTKLIKSVIGDGFMKNADELKKLSAYENDPNFLKDMQACRRANKVRLSNYIKQTSGVSVDPDSMFDIQVKRFHAYKRQLLNIFKVMHLYDKLLHDPGFIVQPTTFVFSGKAAQGYAFAKDVIRLICSVSSVIGNDPRVNEKIKVAFVPNFSVSNAQLIYPAADISEQISTAGLEASGTGNMKFMMNGAITLGTYDGSTIEIADLVGDENIKIFGLRAEEIQKYKREQSYFAEDEYLSNPYIRTVVDQLKDNTFSRLSGDFTAIYNALIRYNDEFFVLKDFQSYVSAWHELERLYSDKEKWFRTSLHNTAMSGFFASDRAIVEYAKDIWDCLG